MTQPYRIAFSAFTYYQHNVKEEFAVGTLAEPTSEMGVEERYDKISIALKSMINTLAIVEALGANRFNELEKNNFIGIIEHEQELIDEIRKHIFDRLK